MCFAGAQMSLLLSKLRQSKNVATVSEPSGHVSTEQPERMGWPHAMIRLRESDAYLLGPEFFLHMGSGNMASRAGSWDGMEQ